MVIAVRPARPDDAAAIAAIYAPHVANGVASFELTAPDAAEMARRLAAAGEQYPWLVASDDVVLGYAYAGAHAAREAYRWAVETTVYVADTARGRGVGRALYAALLAGLRAQGFGTAVAKIALPNPASVALHEALGFRHAGTLARIGWKVGRWVDVGLWQCALATPGVAARAPRAGRGDAAVARLMFGLFRPRPPVSADEFDWLIACYAWLLRALDDGDPARLRRTGAWRERDLFDGLDPGLRGHALAQALFTRTMTLCGMDGWAGELIPGERRRESRVQAGFALKHERQAPLGLFRIGGGTVSIAYDPDLVRAPDRLVATLAHELAHYLLVGKGDPPGGADLIEHATDCAAAYCGFGAFLANAALNFRQFTDFEEQGWEMQAAGYLSEPALATATALSVHLADADPAPVEAMLKPTLRTSFRRALAAVRARLPGGVEDVRVVSLDDWR